MSSNAAMRDIDERTNLTGNSMFELLLFRLGEARGTTKRELFGINVFKVREIMVMPEVTAMVNAPDTVMGVANIRGQMIPVINLPMITGCNPSKGLGILLVTEFARTTQAFAVEEVKISKLMTSADKRLAAISKVVLVRVEFSKKRLNTLLPRNRGTFFTSLEGSVTLTNC